MLGREKEINIKLFLSPIENKFIMTACNTNNRCTRIETMDIHNAASKLFYSDSTVATRIQDQITYAMIEGFKQLTQNIVYGLFDEEELDKTFEGLTGIERL